MPPLEPFHAEAYFAGRWSFLRKIQDLRLGVEGSLLGKARVTRKDGSGDDPKYDYIEKGRLVFGDYSGEATRRYIYRFPEMDLLEVFFEDGRFFHKLALQKGEDCADHHCDPDYYETRLKILSPSSWESRWRVTGPRKNLLMTTRYLKLALTCPGGSPLEE